ncbi:hypothetical protein T492DRAFT_841190 [Pavlovales sp. CCMP2436]|nr:hypothetical protein T492DRAFT_841190 [Pavlovales sp. CCMP2436]
MTACAAYELTDYSAVANILTDKSTVTASITGSFAAFGDLAVICIIARKAWVWRKEKLRHQRDRVLGIVNVSCESRWVAKMDNSSQRLTAMLSICNLVASIYFAMGVSGTKSTVQTCLLQAWGTQRGDLSAGLFVWHVCKSRFWRESWSLCGTPWSG